MGLYDGQASITVQQLLEEPFFNRTREQKEKIVLGGKPRPRLDQLTGEDPEFSSESGGSRVMFYFDVSSYDHVDWMTGCDVRQALFCWPCLLFRTQKDVWNALGIRNLNTLSRDINEHEKCLNHIQAVLDLQVFASNIKVEPEIHVQLNRDLIKRNRGIAERLVDVICFLVSQQRYPRIGSRDKNVLEVEDCLENISFLRDYDILQKNLIDKATDVMQANPKIVTDMIEAINSTMKASFQKEMHQSTYVSLILSEHSSEPSKSQISTVIRYLKNGEICDRFLGFTHADGAKSFNFIFLHINKIINEFQLSRRMSAISFDGSLLPSIQPMVGLKQQLRYRYPYLHFIPCHFHDLDIVLQKSLLHILECDYFFKNMSAIRLYLQDGSKIWQEFKKYVDDIEAVITDLSSSSTYTEFLEFVEKNRMIVLDFFEHIVRGNRKLTDSDMVQIIGFRVFLCDFKNVFLLKTFVKLFDVIAPLTEALKSLTPGLAFDDQLIDSVLKSLDEEIESGSYEILWNKVASDMETFKVKTNVKFTLPKKYHFHRLFTDIAKCISSQIKFRFDDAWKMSFFRILDLENSSKILKQEYVQSLSSCYGYGSYGAFESEINNVMSKEPNMSTASVYDLYSFLNSIDSENCCSNLKKLTELVLTMPSTKANFNGEPTKLDEINLWTFNHGKHENSRDVSFLCIERAYLEKLMTKISFHEEVIYKFQEKNKVMELL